MSDDIKGKPFTSETAPRQGGAKGRKNRKTLYRQMIDAAALKTTNERLAAVLGECVPATVGDQVAAVLTLQALSGDVAAIKELMDGGFGKIIDKSETSTTINTLAVIRDDKGNELKFDIGSDPDRTRKQLEDDNE